MRAFFAGAQKQGALLSLVALFLFGAVRYAPHFLSPFNLTEFGRANALYGCLALGMTFVILSGGIDLSVGSVAALASVTAALVSPHGLWAGTLAALAVGAGVGLLNGVLIVHLRLLPFIATLATLLAARGAALLIAHNTARSVSADSGFTQLAQGTVGPVPMPAVVTLALFLVGSLVLNFTRFGRNVLAVGGNEDAARVMGLPVASVKIGVYVVSGLLAGLAGAMLSALTFTGLPTEGVGWELTAIASVVVGGTLLTGGAGSVAGSLWGALLLALVFNVLNFENGRGTFTLSAYWQNVVRGVFLLLVVLSQQKRPRSA